MSDYLAIVYVLCYYGYKLNKIANSIKGGKDVKRICFLITCLVLLTMFCACAQNGANNAPTQPVYQDGLSPDKTFYQLTDKDGVVVRIPIGRSVSNGASYVAATGDSGACLELLSAEVVPCGNDGIYVFSEYSVISFGYGNAKHPITGKEIHLDATGPYSVPEKYILIIQFTDKERNSVPKDSPDAHVMNIFVLDYKTTPGSFYFVETAEVQCSDNRVLYYYTCDTIVPGAYKTAHTIWSYFEEADGQWYTFYTIQESQEFDTPGCTYTLFFKEYDCAADWTVQRITEYTYYDNYNVETMTIYKADGTKIVNQWFDESGSAFKEDIYDDNGNFLYTEYYNT